VTLASDIITRAHRESNLIPLVATPSANQIAEALPLLNEQFLSALGFEVGDELADLNVGGTYDQSSYCASWIPTNARLILNLSGAQSLNLHPHPYPGQRLAFADAANNLATYNLTLSGNGRRIEGATSIVLNTNGDSRQWLYRGDTANWVKITALSSSDAMPFPQEFDSFFTTKLAMRINPRYGQSLSQETAAELGRIEGRLRARYRKPRPGQDSNPHGLLSQRRGISGMSQAEFDRGGSWRP
jgi:hypothetical protein